RERGAAGCVRAALPGELADQGFQPLAELRRVLRRELEPEQRPQRGGALRVADLARLDRAPELRRRRVQDARDVLVERLQRAGTLREERRIDAEEARDRLV